MDIHAGLILFSKSGRAKPRSLRSTRSSRGKKGSKAFLLSGWGRIGKTKINSARKHYDGKVKNRLFQSMYSGWHKSPLAQR